jgi:hypothetical protein
MDLNMPHDPVEYWNNIFPQSFLEVYSRLSLTKFVAQGVSVNNFPLTFLLKENESVFRHCEQGLQTKFNK